METMTATKPANELTAAELKQLLASKEADEANERKQKRANYEVLRDETVKGMVQKAEGFAGVLKAFKSQTWDELNTLYKMLQEHSSRHADGKGSFTLETADKLCKVQYKRQDKTKFDERATQAEAHIIDFLTNDFANPSDPRNKAIRILLEPKNGKADKDNVLKLISMKDDFHNENWRRGIELYEESIVFSHTVFYAQFFVRDNVDEPWENIVLDFAKL